MFQFKSISLRIRIFFAMIILVLLASVLIVSVTIYQYDEETKEYNIDRFGRKETNANTDINFELRRNELANVTTANLDSIFHQRINEMSIYDLQGNLLISSIVKPINDTINYSISSVVLNALKTDTSNRKFYINEVENVSFETSYTYIKDLQLNRIGILQLEFSQDNTEQQQELQEFMRRLAYVYLFMFLIAIALAYFLSSYITRSIKTISTKIDK